MPYAPTPRLIVETDGPVTTVTLNNPDMRNAFLDDMHDGMQEIWMDLAGDHSIRAVVLTGAGKAFSAGGDIPGFIRSYEDPDHRRHSLRGARRLMDAMAEFPKPVIAAVNGPAIGLGCSVAVNCDIVLIAESAYFADTHVSIGLVCGDGGAVAWPLMMSLLKAKEYLLTGDRIPAAEAVALGLANRVVPDDQLLTEALALARRLAAQPPQAVQETKRALNLHLQAAISLVAPFALSAESESFATDDVRRSIEKFTKG
jgi:enoyl-CoA hydratase/carnithine racemase